MVIRKRFGQHFLHDPAVIRRIVDSVAPTAGERIVEIGPGRGALTWALLERANSLDVIEIDRDLALKLRADPRGQGRIRVHTADVLRMDFEKMRADNVLMRADGPPLRANGAPLPANCPPLRVVGNLPYNISTPVLFRLLSQRRAVADMHFMLQKEVVDRMTAAPGGKQYGRLTVMLGVYATVERLFDVGPGAFKPPPKVWSAVVRLRPTPCPRFDIGSDAALRTLVTAAFSHRRKTLRNGLKGLVHEADFEACGIDPERRPQTLAPAEFGRLAARHCRNAGAA